LTELLVRTQRFLLVASNLPSFADDHVLMALPELYRYGREGKWFGEKLFTIFMLDGVVQVSRWSSCLLAK